MDHIPPQNLMSGLAPFLKLKKGASLYTLKNVRSGHCDGNNFQKDQQAKMTHTEEFKKGAGPRAVEA